MKFPNHILLDVNKPLISTSSKYWIFKYLLNTNTFNYTFNNIFIYKKFYLIKENLFLNKIINNQRKYTILYNYSITRPLSQSKQSTYIDLFKPQINVKNRLLFSKHQGKLFRNYLLNKNKKFNESLIASLMLGFSPQSTDVFKSNNLWNLFDINFLRKEKIYTKLKYSRVPQYDMVSGGAAALFAGFLGFLICEKFGFEMVDSADFYFFFMYVVFLCFFCRLFLKIMDNEKFSWNVLSLKWLFYYYYLLLSLIINFFKFFFKN